MACISANRQREADRRLQEKRVEASFHWDAEVIEREVVLEHLQRNRQLTEEHNMTAMSDIRHREREKDERSGRGTLTRGYSYLDEHGNEIAACPTSSADAHGGSGELAQGNERRETRISGSPTMFHEWEFVTGG
jgi:hypothetical protein